MISTGRILGTATYYDYKGGSGQGLALLNASGVGGVNPL